MTHSFRSLTARFAATLSLLAGTVPPTSVISDGQTLPKNSSSVLNLTPSCFLRARATASVIGVPVALRLNMMSSSYRIPSGTPEGSNSAYTPLISEGSNTAMPVIVPLAPLFSTSRYESKPAPLMNGASFSRSSKLSACLPRPALADSLFSAKRWSVPEPALSITRLALSTATSPDLSMSSSDKSNTLGPLLRSDAILWPSPSLPFSMSRRTTSTIDLSNGSKVLLTRRKTG